MKHESYVTWCLVKEKLLKANGRKKKKLIYIKDMCINNFIVNCLLFLFSLLKLHQCVILLVHINTRVDYIKKNLSDGGYDVAIFPFSLDVCLIPLFGQGNLVLGKMV